MYRVQCAAIRVVHPNNAHPRFFHFIRIPIFGNFTRTAQGYSVLSNEFPAHFKVQFLGYRYIIILYVSTIRR